MTTYAKVISKIDALRKEVEELSAQDDENFRFLDAIVRAVGYGYVSSTAFSCDDDHTIRIHYDSREAMDDASDAIYRIISKYNKDRKFAALDSSEGMQRRADDLLAKAQLELATLMTMRKEQK